MNQTTSNQMPLSDLPVDATQAAEVRGGTTDPTRNPLAPISHLRPPPPKLPPDPPPPRG